MSVSPAPPLPWLEPALHRAPRWVRGPVSWLLPLLWNRDIKITGAGWTIIVTAFLIGAAAYNTGNNLIFMVLASVLGLLVASGLISRLQSGTLHADLRLPSCVRAGEAFEVFVELSNQSRRWPLYGMEVVLELEPATAAPPQNAPGAEGRIFFPHLEPGQSSRRPLMMAAPRRGAYRLRATRLVSRFPFGFVQKIFRLGHCRDLLVLPALIDLGQDPVPIPRAQGRQPRPQRGEGADLYSLRRYREGDPLRLVHWKLSAKSGEKIIREFAAESFPKITVVLDYAPAPGIDPVFERAVSTAATLVELFEKRGFGVGLWTPQAQLPADKTPAQLLAAWKILALLDRTAVRPDRSPPPAASAQSGELLCIQWDQPAPAGMTPVPVPTR
ncbi:MAG: DUF58 domain-containing protein [Verrucomicrobiae bacterium]|nr:DUF58 domain-containing protein [Verrucomicrobiae bacterium]